jgi:class 3 adenylate cyclase
MVGKDAVKSSKVFPGDAGPEDKSITCVAERRQLTVVFVDIVDATSLSERLDPEEFYSIVTAYREICDQQIRHYDGHVAQTTGDGLLAYFGLPRAHEDDAERAIHAALAIAAGMDQRQFPTAEAGLVRVRVRIAVNTGMVVVGGTTAEFLHQRREVFGTPVHIAARLQNIAPSNRVVIGPTTHELIGRAFTCEHFGQHELKGIAHPLDAWLVKGVVESESRFEKTRTAPLSAFVGRSSERTTLIDLWATAAAGSGRVAVVSGEPGIGKSRLVQEFRASLPRAQVETPYLQCSPLHTATPLAPEIARLRRAASLHQSDSASQMVVKLRNLLGTAIPDADEAIRYYGALLSIPACEGFTPIDLASRRERERLLQTMTRVLVANSRIRPILMIVEDVQWIDPTSLELFDRIFSVLANARVLFLVTHRTDYHPDWLSRRNVVAVSLTKLSHQESEHLVETIAKDQVLPRRTLRSIVERTDGVPLFVEEVTRAVLESGKLPTALNDSRVDGAPPELVLPPTIQDLLMERLDNLGNAKRVAQVASILGTQFELQALHALSQISRDALLPALDELEKAGLLRAQGRSEEGTFAFRHALMQEAAYTSMLKEQRRDLHAQAASWLKGLGTDHDSGELAVLGHHYSRAGMVVDAVTAYLAAGAAAMRRSAYKEVIANLSGGADLISKLPESPQRFRLEIALHSRLAMAYAALSGWWHPQVDRAYGRALELCRRHGNVREKSIVLWGLTMARLVNSQLHEALEYSREFVALASESGSDEAALMAHTSMLVVNFFLGKLSDAKSSARRVFERYDPSIHRKLVQIYQHDPKIVALGYAGHVEWLLGHPNQARVLCDDARRSARKLGHPFMLAWALILGTFDHLYDGKHAANLECVEEGIAVAKEHHLPHYEVFGPLWAIPAIADRDPSASCLEELSGLISKLLDNKYYLQAPLYESFLATEFARIGAVERGRSLTRSAEDLMQLTKERWFEPEVYRVRANLLAQGPEADPQAALEYFDRALETAKATQALGWEIRAAVSMANFLITCGKSEDAIRTLTETREKFSAEEVSAELKEADSLLDKLRQRQPA